MNTRERDFLIWVEVQALTAELEGMKAENDQRMVLGQSMAYGKEHFDEIADRMRSAGDKFKTKCVVCGGTDCGHLTGANNMAEVMFGSKAIAREPQPGVYVKEAPMKHEWVGESFDFEGFEKAIKERWEPVSGTNKMKCKKHDTIFQPAGSAVDIKEGKHDPNVEPCWDCYEEFRIRL